MPDTPHPPFAPPALLIPRQLNRWLDINPQGGPLGRTETFIILPAFSLSNDALDAWSDIVAVVPFNSPNRFSIKPFVAPDPASLSYTVCIMWVKAGITYRYVLFHCSSEVFYFNIPDYAGEVIEKNFRFELWCSLLLIGAITTAAATFQTTVLGDLDYRYGVDSPLCVANGEFQDVRVAQTMNGYTLTIFFPPDSVPQSN